MQLLPVTRQRLLSLQQQAHISSQAQFLQLSVRIQTLTSSVLLTKLAEVSKIPVPASLAALKDKEVRFTKVIDKADMKDYIYSALGI